MIALCFASPFSSLAATNVKVFFRDEGPGTPNLTTARIYIKNTGTEALSSFSYYYYLTAENNKTPVVDRYNVPNCNVSLENLGNNNFRIKYSFDGFSLMPGQVNPGTDGNSAGIHYSDWSPMDKSNDFSYISTSTFIETDKIPVFDSQGNLIHGTIPGSQPSGSITDGVFYGLSRYTLFSKEQLILGDSVTVTGGSIGSNGDIETGAGSHIAGSVTSRGNVFLRERARIEGDLSYTGTFSKQNGVVITGTVNEKTSLEKVHFSSYEDTATGTTDIIVTSGETKTLTSGNYRNIKVNSRGTLVLTDGAFFARTLITEPDVTIKVQVADKMMVMLVTQELSLGDRNRITVENGSSCFNSHFLSNQTTPFRIGVGSSITGIFVMPDAAITCASQTTITGALYGRELLIEPRVSINRPPFNSTQILHETDEEMIFCKSLYSSNGANFVDTFGIRDLRQGAFQLFTSSNGDYVLPDWFAYAYKIQELASQTHGLNGVPLLVAYARFYGSINNAEPEERTFFMVSAYKDTIRGQNISFVFPYGSEYSTRTDTITGIFLTIGDSTVVIDEENQLVPFHFSQAGEHMILARAEFKSGYTASNKFRIFVN